MLGKDHTSSQWRGTICVLGISYLFETIKIWVYPGVLISWIVFAVVHIALFSATCGMP